MNYQQTLLAVCTKAYSSPFHHSSLSRMNCSFRVGEDSFFYLSGVVGIDEGNGSEGLLEGEGMSVRLTFPYFCRGYRW